MLVRSFPRFSLNNFTLLVVVLIFHSASLKYWKIFKSSIYCRSNFHLERTDVLYTQIALHRYRSFPRFFNSCYYMYRANFMFSQRYTLPYWLYPDSSCYTTVCSIKFYILSKCGSVRAQNFRDLSNCSLVPTSKFGGILLLRATILQAL